MNVLVLGGTRFMGPYAVRRLVEMGHRVAVFHRGQTEAALPPDVRHIHGDRRQLPDFAGAFREFGPDVVLEMLALTEDDGRRLVRLFRGMARRLVVISSGDVYRAYDRFRRADPGPPDRAPLTEDSPLRERLYPYRDQAQGPGDVFYHYDKILVERAARDEPALPATILRLPMVYGPGDYQHRVGEYLGRMDDGRPAILISRELASWRGIRGYVENVAQAIALCVEERAAGRTYHVADREHLTEVEWIRGIAAAAGWQGRVVPLDDEDLPAHRKPEGDPAQDLALDSSRIREELGYAEVLSPAEAMRRAVSWERAHRPRQSEVSSSETAAEDRALAAASG